MGPFAKKAAKVRALRRGSSVDSPECLERTRTCFCRTDDGADVKRTRGIHHSTEEDQYIRHFPFGDGYRRGQVWKIDKACGRSVNWINSRGISETHLSFRGEQRPKVLSVTDARKPKTYSESENYYCQLQKRSHKNLLLPLWRLIERKDVKFFPFIAFLSGRRNFSVKERNGIFPPQRTSRQCVVRL